MFFFLCNQYEDTTDRYAKYGFLVMQNRVCVPCVLFDYTERQEEKANKIHQEKTALNFKDRKASR